MIGPMRLGGLALALSLAACGPDAGGGEGDIEIGNSAAAADTANSAASVGGKAALPPCPFRETSEWKGSIEGGRLLVTGIVDLQMAGFKPLLTERPSAPGVLAFDLALAPAAGEPVNDKVRLEKPGTARHSAGEIYCGGERIERFDIVNL